YVLDGAPVVTLDANAVVTNTGSNNQIKFKIDLSAAPNLFDATHTFNVATNTTLTLAGVISGASGTTLFGNNLTKTGGGKLALSNQNTYQGPTKINGGTLQLTVNYALWSRDVVTMAAATTFDMTNHLERIGSLAGQGSVHLGDGNLYTGGNDDDTSF